MKIKILFMLVMSLIIYSCAKEFDRVVFNKIETIEKEITIINNKPVQLWVDLKVNYTNTFSLLYDIKLLKNENIIYQNTCDAMDVSIKMYSTEVSAGNNHKIKYQGKLKFKTGNLEPGKYKLIITPDVNGNYKELSKFDIILKQ